MRYFVLIVLAGSLAFAGVFDFGADASKDSRPKSPDALAAMAKYEAAAKRAKAEYDRAMKEATAAAVKDLEAAKVVVMKSGSAGALEEANRIAGTVEVIKATAQEEKTFTVRAGPRPTATIKVTKGKRFALSATGQWCADAKRRSEWTFGAEITAKGGNMWGLWGKIDGGEPFQIGDNWNTEAPATGMLYLFLSGGPKTNPENDDGEVSVTIQ